MAVSFDDVQALWGDYLPLLSQDVTQRWTSLQDGFAWLVLMAPDLWMDVACTAGVCYNRQRSFVYRSAIYSLATCLMFSHAGEATSRLLIGEAPLVLGSNDVLLASTLTWFLLFYTPLRHIYAFLPIKIIFIVGEAICWQRCLCGAIDLAISRFPQSYMTPIIFGVIGGSAGSVLMDLEKWLSGGETGFSALVVKMAFLSSLIYYSQHPGALSHGILAPTLLVSHTKILVGALLIGWSILAEVWQPINPFGWLESNAMFGDLFSLNHTYDTLAGPKPQRLGTGSKAKNHTADEEEEECQENLGVQHYQPQASLRNRHKKKKGG